MSKAKLKQRLASRSAVRQMVADERTFVSLEELRLDGGTQPRLALDEDTVAEYAQRMVLDDLERVVDPEHKRWEPLVVFDDEQRGVMWLADGFHRVHAAKRAGLARFQAQIIPGTQRQAVAYSLSANARHGKRRTNEDKRRAVTRALEDGEWAKMSDRQLAELCAVSDYLVRTVRSELVANDVIAPVAERVGRDGVVHDVRAHTRTSSRKKLTRVELANVESLDELDSTVTHGAPGDTIHSTASTAIVYPSSASHIEDVAQSLDGWATSESAMVVVLPEGILMAGAIASLTEHAARAGMRGPALVGIRRERTHALVFGPSAASFASFVERSADILDALDRSGIVALKS